MGREISSNTKVLRMKADLSNCIDTVEREREKLENDSHLELLQITPDGGLFIKTALPSQYSLT